MGGVGVGSIPAAPQPAARQPISKSIAIGTVPNLLKRITFSMSLLFRTFLTATKIASGPVNI